MNSSLSKNKYIFFLHFENARILIFTSVMAKSYYDLPSQLVYSKQAIFRPYADHLYSGDDPHTYLSFQPRCTMSYDHHLSAVLLFIQL